MFLDCSLEYVEHVNFYRGFVLCVADDAIEITNDSGRERIAMDTLASLNRGREIHHLFQAAFSRLNAGYHA